ncbi:MAG: hypothetical protein APR53_05920 [Methanoculleus sp. SDB]|nr:MAG: hypothetical protein APR53_05920 [Methanoculleus sp. SDB]
MKQREIRDHTDFSSSREGLETHWTKAGFGRIENSAVLYGYTDEWRIAFPFILPSVSPDTFIRLYHDGHTANNFYFFGRDFPE